MSEAQRRAREQERIETLCAAAARALSGVPDLHFRGRRLHRGKRPLPIYAPHLSPALEHDDFGSFRGAADGYGLRLAHSNAALHEALRPTDPVERMVFELLEQFRAEAQAPAGMPGVRHNLRHRFEAWSLAFHHGGGTATVRGLLLYTVAQVCRSRVSGEPVVEETEDLLEGTRADLAPLIGVALAGLRRERHDQAAYAPHALSIARTIGARLAAYGADDLDASDDDAPEDAWNEFSLLLDEGDALDDSAATAVSGRSLVLAPGADDYRVYTTAYDRIDTAASLVRADQLVEFRARLDRRIAALGVNLAHLARDLKALLALPERDGWEGAMEEGVIDGRRLAQLVASPTERRLFRTERAVPRADCLVSVLIDCSGSMKEHIETVAALADVLARALEQAGVASEILGYTTAAWNGGRAQRDWLRRGRPAQPGRLNETSLLIFKSAATAWRHARPGMAAMLKAELFREGVDGEAVDWAMTRSAARDEARRLLIVVSDGSPMDSATNLANGAHCLDRHLQQVVARHEAAGAEIYGVGVGLDLSPYYSRSHVLDLTGTSATAVFRELMAMIGRRSTR